MTRENPEVEENPRFGHDVVVLGVSKPVEPRDLLAVNGKTRNTKGGPFVGSKISKSAQTPKLW